MKQYDVIIIGAGPAGLNCADILAQTGRNILILEQNDVIGPKVCAGGLTVKSNNYLNLPNSLINNKFKSLKFHTPLNNTRVSAANFFLFTIDREILGQWQLKKLTDSNIDIKNNSQVTRIGKDYIELNNSEKIGFKYLVGADGSASLVRRYLGIPTEKIGMAIQYIIPSNIFENIEIFYNSRLFHTWYAWIFPHKNYVSIGCGCNPKSLPVKVLRNNFHKWLKIKNIDISQGEFQAYPINCDYRGYQFNNIFLAGDAAGLASGFTGEGIYQALISGEEIARIIIDNKYQPNKIKEIIKFNSRHHKIVRILEKSGFMRPLLYEMINLSLKNKHIVKKVLDILL
jgi:geranylgeranyl reductase